MNDAVLQQTLFNTLKNVLKQRKMTYADLAEKLDVSELTVKRLFRDKDCKFSRLLEICTAAEVQFEDLLELQKRQGQVTEYLPLETEQQLAEKPAVFSFLILLVSRFNLDYIRDEFGLKQHEIYLYLRELETLGIVSIREDSYRFSVPTPIKWRLHGPIGQIIVKANQKFVELSFQNQDKEEVEVTTQSRLLSPSSMKEMQEEIRRISELFNVKATEDQLLYDGNQLTPVKLLGIAADFPVEKIFPVPPYEKSSDTN